MRKHWIVQASRAVVFYLLATAVTLPSSGPQDRTALMKQASIIFRGTVKKKGDVSFKGVPKSDRTIVVMVDEVIQKPSAVSLAKGAQVTVDAIDAAALSVGSSFVFYTEGWIYGSGVAVREIGHEAAPVRTAELAEPMRAQLEQTRKEVSDSELRSRLDAADIVVTGQVTAVHPWNPPSLVAARPRISEHAANWQEAVIRVETALKGAPADHEVVVRFPGSWDIAWASTPKLQSGQSGTFILQKDKITGVPRAALAGRSVDAHTAMKPGDVLPISEAQRVRALLRKE